jgi:hypothetical protein
LNTDPIELVRMIDGTGLVNADAMALLIGISADEINALYAEHAGAYVPVPDHWLQQGRRRSREAQAHTGADDMVFGAAVLG